jgi:hypothetical protein
MEHGRQIYVYKLLELGVNHFKLDNEGVDSVVYILDKQREAPRTTWPKDAVQVYDENPACYYPIPRYTCYHRFRNTRQKKSPSLIC